jgi:hypothetical protein
MGRNVVFSANVIFAWLILLFHIREVPGSNLDPETGYTAFPAVFL